MSDSIEKIADEMQLWAARRNGFAITFDDASSQADAIQMQEFADRLRAIDSLRQVPEGWVLVPRRLTAENGAKGLLSGEFQETTHATCGHCDGDGYIDDVVCGDCEGECSVEVKVPVSWDTIKQIHRMVVDNLAVEPNPAPPTSGPCRVCDGAGGCISEGDGYGDESCDACDGTGRATPAQAVAEPCGGCGERDPAKRCIGCGHQFEFAPTMCAYAARYKFLRESGLEISWNAQVSFSPGYAGDADRMDAAIDAAIRSLPQAGAELPELPAPSVFGEHAQYIIDPNCPRGYTAEQMRAYAELARRGV